jgi:hypothetical protein
MGIIPEEGAYSYGSVTNARSLYLYHLGPVISQQFGAVRTGYVMG